MEESVAQLAQRIVAKYRATRAPHRVLVAVAGVPGSGKSVLAYPLADRVNQLLGSPQGSRATLNPDEAVAHPGESAEGDVAICVGLDGWHCTRAELDAFPDPAEARRRRGAAFTFDGAGYTSFVLSLRADPLPAAIAFPTFSHALKDPLLSEFPILPSHRIVIIEGLYALVNIPPWSDSVAVLDERVWVECPREVARDRLVRRHLASGVERTREKAEDRVDQSDMHNADWIRAHLTEPTAIVNSVEDSEWATRST